MPFNKTAEFAKFASMLLIFFSLYLMGLQFTEHQFISKESLIGPVIILAAVLGYHLFFDRKGNYNSNLLPIAVSSILFFTYYATNTNDVLPLKTEYMISLFVILVLFLSVSFFENPIIPYSRWIIFVFFYVNLLYLPALLTRESFIAANSNGIIIFLLLFFCLINLKESNLFLRIVNIYNFIFLLFSLSIATSRSAIVAFIIVIITLFTIKYVHKFIFYIVSSVILLSPLISLGYIYLKATSLGILLNDLAVKYTGKNFFSGRDRIWKEAIDSVYHHEKFWTGIGNNMEYRSLGGYLHNLYIQTFYQSGFIGIILILILLIALTYAISKAPVKDYEFKVLFSYFMGILFLQVFEGHLIYKFEIISVLCWIFIALLINKSAKRNQFSNYNKLYTYQRKNNF